VHVVAKPRRGSGPGFGLRLVHGFPGGNASGKRSVSRPWFTLIALPWLVLQLSGDALVLGTVLAIDACAGLAFLPFGHVHATWQGLALLLPLGAMGGFVQVAVYTWMQQRIPSAMLGRAMSLFMFIFMGIAPLAAAAAGAALKLLGLAMLFSASGAALLLIVALGLALTPMRRIRDATPAPGLAP